MRIKFRRIAANHASSSPSSFLFFDTETKQIDSIGDETLAFHKFSCAHARYFRFDGGKFTRRCNESFSTQAGLWKWIYERTDKRRPLYVFAHNIIFDLISADMIGQFRKCNIDVASLGKRKTYLPDGQYQESDRTIAVIDSPPFILCLEHIATKSKIYLIDTLNYFNSPLTDIASSVGIEKIAVDFATCTQVELLEHCIRDVEIIERAIEKLLLWHRKNELGKFKFTAAGIAWHAYRHRFMPAKLFSHDCDEVKKIERQSYFGGQTECYKLGNIGCRVYALDVASLYPSVMARNLYPTCLVDYCLDCKLLGDIPQGNLRNVIADVGLCTENLTFPYRRIGDTIYPLGHYRTVLSGPELEYAMANGLIKDFYSYARYRVEDIFTAYVDYFWQQRIHQTVIGNRTHADFCKICLNSLYGKFAQKTPQWVDEPSILASRQWSTWIEVDMVNNRVDRYRSVGDVTQRKSEPVESAGSIPAISSFVTSYGRQRMRHLRYIAGQGNVYYLATDMIVVNETGYNNLFDAGEIASQELGKLRFKFTADDFCARGSSRYYSNGKLTVAGLRSNAVPVEGNTYCEAVFPGVSSLFSACGQSQVVIEARRKTLNDAYPRGIVMDNGIVRPHWIDSDFDNNHSRVAAAPMNDAR